VQLSVPAPVIVAPVHDTALTVAADVATVLASVYV
jgi:hypothetical protein